MNIFLVRHGDAENLQAGMSDAERGITAEGEILLRKAAEGWKKLVPTPDYIVSSPLKRAIQTASFIKQTFGFEKEIIIDRQVLGGKTSYLLGLCAVLHGGNIFIVGHEPDFSRYVSEMISATGAGINFKKGMIAKISFNAKLKPGLGVLELLIPQKAYK
jgi:phosphohistidine phosphatase